MLAHNLGIWQCLRLLYTTWVLEKNSTNNVLRLTDVSTPTSFTKSSLSGYRWPARPVGSFWCRFQWRQDSAWGQRQNNTVGQQHPQWSWDSVVKLQQRGEELTFEEVISRVQLCFYKLKQATEKKNLWHSSAEGPSLKVFGFHPLQGEIFGSRCWMFHCLTQ